MVKGNVRSGAGIDIFVQTVNLRLNNSFGGMEDDIPRASSHSIG
jgi:hypothetical protein